jgi:hypothetical protein
MHLIAANDHGAFLPLIRYSDLFNTDRYPCARPTLMRRVFMCPVPVTRAARRLPPRTMTVVCACAAVALLLGARTFVHTKHTHTPPVNVKEVRAHTGVHAPSLCRCLQYVTATNSTKQYLCIGHRWGRLGNMLFIYASILGLADRNRRVPCIEHGSTWSTDPIASFCHLYR